MRTPELLIGSRLVKRLDLPNFVEARFFDPDDVRADVLRSRPVL